MIPMEQMRKLTCVPSAFLSVIPAKKQFLRIYSRYFRLLLAFPALDLEPTIVP